MMQFTILKENPMTDLRIFENEEFGKVRTTTIDSEPWFVGKDVAAALGYKNSRDALAKHVDEEDKDVAKRDTLGGTQEMIIINESGLYSLILSSKLPNAKRFKRWVTSEVLPAIRKTGSYTMPAQQYEPKRTSVGEVASLIFQLRQTQKAQGSSARKVAKTVEFVCEQFGIALPDDFIEPVRQPVETLNPVPFYFNTTPGKAPWAD